MKVYRGKSDDGRKTVSVDGKPAAAINSFNHPLTQHRGDWLERLRERIKPDELAKQGFPRPKDVQLSQSTDSTGEDAFYVFLIFPDKTPDDALAWEKIEPMVSWVRDLIWTETGERLWPYVKVKRQKQLAGGVT